MKNMWSGGAVDRAVMPQGELLLLIEQQKRQIKQQEKEIETQKQELQKLRSQLEATGKRKREEQDTETLVASQ